MVKAVMKVALIAIICVLVPVSPSSADRAGIGWKETIVAKSGKAKTIAELVKDVRLKLLRRMP